MRLLRSGLIYTAANLATAALPLLLLPILTRTLGPVEYGQVVAFALIVTLAGAVAGMNVHGAVGVLWFRREPEEMKDIVGAAMFVAILSTVIVAPLVALILYLFPDVGAGLSPIWGAAAAVTAGANVVIQARLALWRARQLPWRMATLQFSTAALNLALSLLAVLVLGLGAGGRNGGYLAATLVAALVAICALMLGNELRWTVRRQHLAELLRFGAPLIIHLLASAILTTADRWVVSIRLDAEALGIYGAGAQLGMVMAILGDAFVKAYAPWFYERLRADTHNDRLWAVGASYAAIPFFLLVGLCVGFALHIVSGIALGPAYAASASLLPWFMLGGALSGVYLSVASLYFFHGRTGLLATVAVASGLVGLTTTVILTTAFGMAGAAAGYAASQAVLGFVSLGVAMRTFDLPWGRPIEALRFLHVQAAAALPGRFFQRRQG